MFASKALPRYQPGHFDGDRCVFPDPGHFTPRQHNPPNPILVAFRVDMDGGPVGYVVGGRRPTRLQHWLLQLEASDRVAISIGTGVQVPSLAHVEHARRVLRLLERVTS